MHDQDSSERGASTGSSSIDERTTPMLADDEKTHRLTCAVELSTGEVDAATDMMLNVRVSCPSGCDLTGLLVSVRNQDDAELACSELTEFDGEAYRTTDLVLKAPSAVGEHRYRSTLLAHEKNGVAHAETSTEFVFVVKAHAARINVWGVPSAV